jgi:hypothetical protein
MGVRPGVRHCHIQRIVATTGTLRSVQDGEIGADVAQGNVDRRLRKGNRYAAGSGEAGRSCASASPAKSPDHVGKNNTNAGEEVGLVHQEIHISARISNLAPVGSSRKLKSLWRRC